MTPKYSSIRLLEVNVTAQLRLAACHSKQCDGDMLGAPCMREKYTRELSHVRLRPR